MGQVNGERASTALVPSDGAATRRSGRPSAAFLAQLIACHRRLPAYRQARRADPEQALLGYAGPARRAAGTIDRDA